MIPILIVAGLLITAGIAFTIRLFVNEDNCEGTCDCMACESRRMEK